MYNVLSHVAALVTAHAVFNHFFAAMLDESILKAAEHAVALWA